MYKEIEVNELPTYSPWPARLLLDGKWDKSARTVEKVLAEYDADKYTKLLSYWLENRVTAKELRKYEIGKAVLCPFSTQGRIYLDSPNEILDIADRVLLEAISAFIPSADTVIELGAGWGYNLFTLCGTWPGKKYIGGDISPKAVELASRTAEGYPNTSFELFNFLNSTWSIFDDVKGKAIVLTRHAIEQLPSAQSAVAQLMRHKDKIGVVVHLEPIYELISETSLLGLLRKSYTEANNYNTDLLTAVKSVDGEILKTGYDILGSNPLNPTSKLIWKPN
jgi:hypothetical protein